MSHDVSTFGLDLDNWSGGVFVLLFDDTFVYVHDMPYPDVLSQVGALVAYFDSGVTGLVNNGTVADGDDVPLFTVQAAGTATQLLVVREGGSAEIICYTDELDPFTFALDTEIGLTWSNGPSKIYTTAGAVGVPTIGEVASPVDAPGVPDTRGPGRFEVWNSTNTAKLADLHQVEDSGKTDDVENELGLLYVKAGADETAAEFCVEGNHVRAYLGTRLVFTALIEDGVERVVIDPTPAKQVITLSLRGHAAVLGQVPIIPHGGLDVKPQSPDRPHKWSSPETDISEWDDVTIVYDALSEAWQDPQTDPPWFTPWLTPVGMTDEESQWMWCRPIDPETGHPVGEVPIVKDVEVENDGLHLLQVAADDGFDADVDGITVGSGAEPPGDSFVTAWQGVWEFTAGTHRIGILGKNYDRPPVEAVGTFGGPNVGRVAFTMWYLPDGENTVLNEDLIVARSDGSWKTLDYPESLPSPTEGAVAIQHLTEAQTVGPTEDQLPDDITVGFTATRDSADQPWVDNGAQSLQVDDDTLLSWLLTGSQSGRFDWRMDRASRRLDMWNPGTMGSAHDAEYTIGDGLVALTSTTQPVVRSFQVRHKTGRVRVGSGLPCKQLKLADLDKDAAIAEAERRLISMSAAASSKVVVLELGPDAVGTANAPYGDGGWLPGDSPSFNAEHLKVPKVSTLFGVDGWPTFVPEVETRLQGDRERAEIQLARVAGGTLNGQSRAATPIDGLTRGIVAGFAQRADKITITQVQLTPDGLQDVYDISNSRKWETAVRAYRIDLSQFVAPQDTDTVVWIQRTGPLGEENVAQITLPVGFYRATLQTPYLHFGILDEVHAVWKLHDTATGDPLLDARWATVTIYTVEATPSAVKPAGADVPW